jgi:uncharacterized protein (TIGR03435 family)
MQRIWFAGVVAFGIASGVLAQPAPKRPSFEVASVRLNTLNGPVDFVPHRSGDRVTMHNIQLGQVVAYAYHIANPLWELAGNYRLPDGWNWYDIEAIAPGSPRDDELRLMFQALLEDRFQVRVHRETRDSPTYDLVIGKGGSRLKPATPDSQIAVNGKTYTIRYRHGGWRRRRRTSGGKGVTAAQLSSSLSGRFSAPVRDRTGLTGTFDYNVVFARDDNPPAVSELPTLMTALQQELGLRLEKNKGTVEVRLWITSRSRRRLRITVDCAGARWRKSRPAECLSHDIY